MYHGPMWPRFFALRLAAALLVTMPWLMAPSCGNDAARQPAGYPCTRNRDCGPTLMCIAGSCREEPSDGPTSDGPTSDGPTSDGSTSDGPTSD